MKFFFFLLTVSALMVSCSSSKVIHDEVRTTTFSKKAVPPGTVWLVDSLFMDKQEITVSNWHEYLFDLNRRYGYDSDEFQSALPLEVTWDSVFQTTRTANAGSHFETYFFHSAYRNFPIVNIKQLQASKFCDWRTAQVNKYLAIKNKEWKAPPNGYPKQRIRKRVKYRLPRVTEWEYAASAGLDTMVYRTGFEKNVNSEQTPMTISKDYMNLYYPNVVVSDSTMKGLMFGIDLLKITSKTASTYPGTANKFGIKHTSGSVSEMMAETGIAKGGSFKDYLSDYHIGREIRFDKPAYWLGFRCICELLE